MKRGTREQRKVESMPTGDNSGYGEKEMEGIQAVRHCN